MATVRDSLTGRSEFDYPPIGCCTLLTSSCYLPVPVLHVTTCLTELVQDGWDVFGKL